MSGRRIPLAALLLAALATVLLAACGGEGEGETAARPAPAATEFPSPQGKTIEEVLLESTPAEAVVSPAATSFVVGPNRYPFGVFDVGGAQIDDADVAIYFAKDKTSPVIGPLPARVGSLETKPAYRAAGAGGPGEATSVYVVPEVDFDRSGPWLGIALMRGPNGLEGARLPSPVVGQLPGIPEVGEKAPVAHTPTAADVGGDLSKIDTRIPPNQMHEVDFADVVGREPVVIVFATPAFCESRVCGPVVDIAQQVADQHKGEVDFIHMEVWEDNDPGTERVRPQLRAFGLETEPWTFVIDSDGVVRERIEGAYSVDELEEAVAKVVPG